MNTTARRPTYTDPRDAKRAYDFRKRNPGATVEQVEAELLRFRQPKKGPTPERIAELRERDNATSRRWRAKKIIAEGKEYKPRPYARGLRSKKVTDEQPVTMPISPVLPAALSKTPIADAKQKAKRMATVRESVKPKRQLPDPATLIRFSVEPTNEKEYVALVRPERVERFVARNPNARRL